MYMLIIEALYIMADKHTTLYSLAYLFGKGFNNSSPSKLC